MNRDNKTNHIQGQNKEQLAATTNASMLNFVAFGTAQLGLSVTAMFTAISGMQGQVLPAVLFGLSLLPHAGLCWLNYQHLKAYDGPNKPRPLIEPEDIAKRRCKDAFKRLVAPAVIAGASLLVVNMVSPPPPTPDNQQVKQP